MIIVCQNSLIVDRQSIVGQCLLVNHPVDRTLVEMFHGQPETDGIEDFLLFGELDRRKRWHGRTMKISTSMK